MGDVMGQITSKRGHVLGMDSADGLQHLKAQVPQAEMFHYATELRSITQGRGRFSWKLDHYAEVPHNIAEKVVAEAASQRPRRRSAATDGSRDPASVLAVRPGLPGRALPSTRAPVDDALRDVGGHRDQRGDAHGNEPRRHAHGSVEPVTTRDDPDDQRA